MKIVKRNFSNFGIYFCWSVLQKTLCTEFQTNKKCTQWDVKTFIERPTLKVIGKLELRLRHWIKLCTEKQNKMVADIYGKVLKAEN